MSSYGLCFLLLAIFLFNGIEAVTLTCSPSTDVCPSTEVICTCSVSTVILDWTKPTTIEFDGANGVNDTMTNGIYTAVVTSESGPEGGKVSELMFIVSTDTNVSCEDRFIAQDQLAETAVIIADVPGSPIVMPVPDATTYNSVTIQLSPPSNGTVDITGYIITVNSSSLCPCNVSSDASEYTITGLDHTEVYFHIDIRAVNCAGIGESTSVIAAIEAEVPNVARNVIARNMNDNNIILEWRCPIDNPLSPPVDTYTISINNMEAPSVNSNDMCDYTTIIDISGRTAPYSVSIVATNDVGESESVDIENIGSVQDIISVTVTNTSDTLDFSFTTTAVPASTTVTITLTPDDGSGTGTIGDGVVITGLTPGITYTYTISFSDGSNSAITYSLQSSIFLPSIAVPSTSTSVTVPPQASTVSTATMMTTTGAPIPSPTSLPIGIDVMTIIIIVVVVVVVVIAILIMTVLIIGICIKVKSKSSKGDDGVALRGEYRRKSDDPAPYVEKPLPETGQSGPMYQDPSTIERQQAPTGDFYALPDKRSTGSRRQPPAAPTELATYQDPSTIQHEAAPTGDLYAMPDKKPAGIAKQDDRTYAALEFENGTGSASTSFQGKPRQPDVLYSEVQPQS